MSGAGSGGGRPPSIDQGTPCSELSFETLLATPVEDVVRRLSKGDILQISLQGDDQIVIVKYGNHDAGAIVVNLPELLRCLQQGAEFEAEVKDIDDGAITVEVRPK